MLKKDLHATIKRDSCRSQRFYINPVCAFLMEPFQKTKFYPIAHFKASLLNIHRKDWNFMGKLVNLF